MVILKSKPVQSSETPTSSIAAPDVVFLVFSVNQIVL